MKHFKIGNRILALLMAVFMMLGGATTAFAAENTSDYEVKSVTEGNEIMPRDAQYWTNDIRPGNIGSCDFYLNSYIGFTKTLHITVYQKGTLADGSNPSGNVKCQVFRDDGSHFGTYDLTVGSYATYSHTLPASGRYTLKVTNNTNVTVSVKIQWN